MATNPAVKELYPLSTLKGDSIPLEVAGAEFLIKKALTAGIPASITLPASCKICSFYAPNGCYIDFSNTISAPLVDGTLYNNLAFILPDSVVILATDSVTAIKALSEANTTLIIQGIRKWAGIGLESQLKNK